MADNYCVKPFSYGYLDSLFHISDQDLDRIKYIHDYFIELKKLTNIKKITIVREKDYVDKFFLRDYSRYYAESFSMINKKSERLHLFSGDFSEGDFNEILEKKSNYKIVEYGLIDSDETETSLEYLGHITMKPVKGEYGTKLIGRTALPPYPEKDGDKTRIHLKTDNKCSLFGIDLNIKSLPFHEQDIAVGACASASLWISQFPINKWYNIPIHSLAEITEISRLQAPYSLPNPLYPSEGLSASEMVSYFESIGLHFQVFDIQALMTHRTDIKTTKGINVDLNNLIEDIIKAYFTSNFPIICSLDLDDDFTGGHAVVLSGYKINKENEIDELYLHDDKIGPYCRTFFDDGIKNHWKNDWVRNGNIDRIQLRKFIIPLDPQIKLHFLTCFDQLYEWKFKTPRVDFILYHISKYKEKLLENNFENKINILSKNMPRYVWVAHFYDEDTEENTRDWIIDANSVYLRKPIDEIIFIK